MGLDYREYSPTEDRASFLEKLFFSFVTPVFTLGNQKGYRLMETDMLQVLPTDRPEVISEDFSRLLKEEIEKAKNGNDFVHSKPVTRALIRKFKPQFIRILILKFISSTIAFSSPVFLQQLLTSLGDPNTNLSWMWAFLMIFTLVVKTFLENFFIHRAIRIGYNVRTSVVTAVFKKSLLMSPTARQEVPIGQICNLMAIDAQRLDMLMFHFHVIFTAPYDILVNVILIIIYAGWQAALTCLGALMFFLPLSMLSMMSMGKIRRTISKNGDNRLKIISEIINGIKAIKLYAWENSFIRRVQVLREKELMSIRKYQLFLAFASMVVFSTPILTSIVTIIVAFEVSEPGKFQAANAFTTIALLNSLRMALMMLPMVLRNLIDSKVALRRLNDFILMPEVGFHALMDAEDVKHENDRSMKSSALDMTVPPSGAFAEFPFTFHGTSSRQNINSLKKWLEDPENRRLYVTSHWTGSPFAISVLNGNFYWEDPLPRVERLTAKAKQTRLEDIKAGKKRTGNRHFTLPPITPIERIPPVLASVDMAVPKGQLWAIVGPVGSGKSALLTGLLGELASAGDMPVLFGKCAYVSQGAWVLNASVRENICFARQSEPQPDSVLAAVFDSTNAQNTGAKEIILSPTDVQLDPRNVLEKGRKNYENDVEMEQLYQSVLSAAQLRPDIAVLPDGDQTEIGERGITLSGGQKQRVSLARAAFSGADIVLFDDPLSALDAEVGKKVFDELICGLCAKATRLLVTNALQYLEKCDGIIVMAKDSDGVGRIACSGSFEELMSVDAFREMMENYGHESENSSRSDPTDDSELNDNLDLIAGDEKKPLIASTMSTGKEDGTNGGLPVDEDNKVVEVKKYVKKNAQVLIAAEERNSGSIKMEYYVRYFKYTGSIFLSLSFLFIVYTFNAGAQYGTNLFLSIWTSDSEMQNHSKAFYIAIYASLGLATAFSMFLRMVVLALLGIRASRRLHSEAFNATIQATPAYFDTTSTGVILNRYGKDVEAVNALVESLQMILMSIFNVLGGFAAIIYSNPWFALTCPIFIGLYLLILRFYLTVSREVKRLDSITRSFIYASFGEVLGGLSVLRAYSLQEQFTRENEAAVQRNLSAWYTLKSSDRWLNVRLESLGNLIVLVASLFAIGISQAGRGDASAAALAGFSLTSAMSITNFLSMAVRQAAEMEQNMNSFERIAYFCDEVPTEAYSGPRHPPHSIKVESSQEQRPKLKQIRSYSVPDIGSDAYMKSQLPHKFAASTAPSLKGTHSKHAGSTAISSTAAEEEFPKDGRVELENVRLRYRPGTPLVLRGVTFSVADGEKVGLIGRTGAGKSSIFQALTRFTEEDCHDGYIRIGGRDIDTLGLTTLRAGLSIIPQDPMLFSGTLRSNLDPTGVVDDDERLWAVLEKVGLKDVVQRLPGQLESIVAENGDSLSVGQRQLICLARVLISKSKVLLLDEASASLDHESDLRMQSVIKECFQDSTIICIAHRLHTVIDYDRILVLDKGVVAEFDAPHILLSNKDSKFSALIDELGEKTAAVLRARAKEAYELHSNRNK